MTLSSHPDLSVQVASIEAMEGFATRWASCPEVVDSLHTHYDKLVTDGVHEVQLAVIQTLASAAGQASVHIEFLLKEILLLLARVQQRSTAGKSFRQLQEVAAVSFEALRVLDRCEVGHVGKLLVTVVLGKERGCCRL